MEVTGNILLFVGGFASGMLSFVIIGLVMYRKQNKILSNVSRTAN